MPAITSPATRCRDRSHGSTSCPRPAAARSSSASCGLRSGRIARARSDVGSRAAHLASEQMRSGFITFVGRPNVGKSTLLNAVTGRKVSIVSDKPQTTRLRVRGILNLPDVQLVFVDTPGLHKPVTALGERVNATALESAEDVDVVCLVIDATMPFGAGDQWVADRININKAVVIVNKVDATSKEKVFEQLVKVS